MIVINTDTYNGNRKGNVVFMAIPILSGEHKGKFACHENALKEFPEIFESEEYEIAELSQSDFEVDYTPPELSKYGILIPEKYQFIFRDYVFKVGGFEVPLEDDAKGLYVNLSYLGWQAFKDELDKEENQWLKLALEPVWDYALEQAEKNNLILLEEF